VNAGYCGTPDDEPWRLHISHEQQCQSPRNAVSSFIAGLFDDIHALEDSAEMGELPCIEADESDDGEPGQVGDTRPGSVYGEESEDMQAVWEGRRMSRK